MSRKKSPAEERLTLLLIILQIVREVLSILSTAINYWSTGGRRNARLAIAV
jgi:hypothetical protein